MVKKFFVRVWEALALIGIGQMIAAGFGVMAGLVYGDVATGLTVFADCAAVGLAGLAVILSAIATIVVLQAAFEKLLERAVEVEKDEREWREGVEAARRQAAGVGRD